MKNDHSRREFIGTVGAVAGLTLFPTLAGAQKKGGNAGEYVLPADLSMHNALSVVLGRAGDKSITANLFAREKLEALIEYGTEPGKYDRKTNPLTLNGGQPVELAITDLRPGTRYYYRLSSRKPGDAQFKHRSECQFQTQRAPGDTFTFCVQGDSHPERPQMSEPNLYARTILRAAADKPDLYFCMGDDFSVDKVRTVNAASLAAPYLLQRPFLSLIAQCASLYLVNGNHEQASLYNYNRNDELHEVAVGVQTARNNFFPMPATESIYTGDTKHFDGIGLLRDYYSWTWGAALFVVLDNYWHSPVQVDSGFKGGANGKNRDDKKNRDWWGITIGDEQYRWFKKTLEGSTAIHKFVFAHHVHGSGRGGIESCDLYEWGGQGRNRSTNEFKVKRPTWELPIHQLMVKHGVSIFFQGHDHLYARQERDGVVYQEVPLPADHLYETHNEYSYTSGVKKSNSGYLRVNVSPKETKVEYVRCWLPKDETATQKSGDVAHCYTVAAKA